MTEIDLVLNTRSKLILKNTSRKHFLLISLSHANFFCPLSQSQHLFFSLSHATTVTYRVKLCIYSTHLYPLLNSRAQLHNSRGNTHNLSLYPLLFIFAYTLSLSIMLIWKFLEFGFFTDLMRRYRFRSLLVWNFILGVGYILVIDFGI